MLKKIRFKLEKNLTARGIKYSVLSSLKQDSSKQIFKAVRKDQSTGISQEVLLKIFLNEKQSYRDEFESLSKVSSPYCVRLFGFEQFDSQTALVLEYIKGVSLFELAFNFSLSAQEIRYILISIYKGLLALRKQGLCHGDLSLDNILIDEKAQIKLIDFGKANYEKVVKGTPPFIAPEILKGARANFFSDLYSLGVIEAALNKTHPLDSLENIKLQKLNSPLLSSDPKKRHFHFNEKELFFKSFKTLSYKVKDLLLLEESRRCRTIKDLSIKPFSIFNFLKPILLLGIAFVFGGVSFQRSPASYGWVKVYTHQWFTLRVKDFESYTPFVFPLKAGKYFIHWKNDRFEGTKNISISKGQSLFLNDKSFTDSL